MARGRITRTYARTKRGNVWIGLFGSTSSAAVAAATPILIGSLNAAALALRPFTIVRTRGVAIWESDQIAASELPFGAFGIQVVSDSAAAAGVSSVPTPTTQTDADFFVYEPLATSFVFASAIGIATQGGMVKEFDSKAMRKVGNDDDVVVTVEHFSGSFGALFNLGGRMLVKLL